MRAWRWLLLGSHIPPAGGLGGMIRYAVEVTRSLERREDVELHVHCQPRTVPFLRDELGVASERLHPSATGSTIRDSVQDVFRLGRLSRELKAEVVFGPKQLIPRRRAGDQAMRLLTVHDMLPYDRPADFGPLKRSLLPAAYRRSIQETDLLVCVSAAAQARLLQHLPEVRARSVVVANAMTSALATAAPQPIRELRGRRFALVVGDRSRRKNTGFVVGLWPAVRALVPDAHLALVGPPGWGRTEDTPQLQSLLAQGAISELGRIDDGALRWAYEHASVTLCPSLLEGFGLPVVEALAFACPAVISADPAQVEAAAGAATVIGVDDAGGWIAAIAAHLQAERRPAANRVWRTWDDVAAELVAAVATARSAAPPAGRGL